MLPLNRGLSRALKTVRRTVFAPRYADASLDLRLPHQAAPLGRGLPSATAAPAPAPCFRRRRRSPPQQAVLVPDGAPSSCFPENSNKKYPAASCEVFCGAPSGTRTQDPLIKSQLLSQMTQTKPILKSVQTSFIALSSLFHVKLDLLLFEFAFFKQPDTTPKSNTIH